MGASSAGVLDLHYQSVRSAAAVLDELLPTALHAHPEVWVITGTGHHVAANSHQKNAEGGVLRATVEEYLQYWGYEYYAGRDNAGQSGALLVLAWE